VSATPNPVQDRVTISYALERGGPVACAIYDAAGNRIAELGVEQAAGSNSVTWNSTGVRPGVYLCRLTAGAESRAVRLVKVQ
jgi:hypothetical protein